MKRMICVLGIAGWLVACDNNGTSTQQKLDSIGERLENTAERTWDSTKEKARDLKERIEDRLEDRDTSKRKNDTLNKS